MKIYWYERDWFFSETGESGEQRSPFFVSKKIAKKWLDKEGERHWDYWTRGPVKMESAEVIESVEADEEEE